MKRQMSMAYCSTEDSDPKDSTLDEILLEESCSRTFDPVINEKGAYGIIFQNGDKEKHLFSNVPPLQLNVIQGLDPINSIINVKERIAIADWMQQFCARFNF
jgi:hypothetical protein